MELEGRQRVELTAENMQYNEATMKSVSLPYPDDLESAVHLTPDELAAQIRLMAALKMFELGKLASGKAAELAGMSRVAFLDMCGRYHLEFRVPNHLRST